MSETKNKLAQKFLLEFIKTSDLTPEDEQVLFQAVKILEENK